jgi:hypothetical protein
MSPQQCQTAGGSGSGVSDRGPFVNESLALCVRRASDVGQFKLPGSKIEAAVDLIGRCLSSRALSATPDLSSRLQVGSMILNSDWLLR